ncbi:2Fe-2S iron-sulfur cluster binding domain-containing protein [Pseudomonas sp. gcc21]|uniref:2Fe-2S iron-sulfur cluster-binding protein n=1 Tax=Pseudomonas sp. gcc21 TaxID=2726989 RepID=UPI00145206C5|nr:2Fe-2S iron-sulfur cluster-binding protein [Pseudomonas sp. gcc21]QJD58781.1 2Fe-2S iron-sulfur cluster binding domain-containing protein [Pseudomonas sp. gcc21]
MPELRLGNLTLHAHHGKNLLDTLLAQGQSVPWSCRGGYCHTCLIQAQPGQAPAEACHMLTTEQREAGWLLSCQCPVVQDMDLRLHDPARDDLSAEVVSVTPVDNVVILRLRPERPLRFLPGQHLALWLDSQLGRPYSIASLPGEPWLEFHIRRHASGAFSRAAADLSAGDKLFLGSPTGALQYDPDWQDRPLLLLAAGTGLAPLQAILRHALESGHEAPIELWHWSTSDCYLENRLGELADQHSQLTVKLQRRSTLADDIRQLRIASRRTMALICGDPGFVEHLRKPLFFAGLPGRQVLDEAFHSRPQ